MKRVLRKKSVVRRLGFQSVVLLCLLSTPALAQSFTNLNFESANLTGYSPGSVPAADAVPGWTVYVGGTAQTTVKYNISYGSFGIGLDILDAGSGTTIRQGSYQVFLQGGHGSSLANLGQTGTIPVSAQSLFFWAGPLTEAPSFDGHTLSLTSLGGGIYGADISAYAGQTGELLFKSDFVPGGGGYFLDDIQFSDQPIPEPGTLGLLLVGAALTGARRLRRFATGL